MESTLGGREGKAPERAKSLKQESARARTSPPTSGERGRGEGSEARSTHRTTNQRAAVMSDSNAAGNQTPRTPRSVTENDNVVEGTPVQRQQQQRTPTAAASVGRERQNRERSVGGGRTPRSRSRSRSVSRSMDLSGFPLTPVTQATPHGSQGTGFGARSPNTPAGSGLLNTPLRSDMGHTHSGQRASILFRRRDTATPSVYTPVNNRIGGAGGNVNNNNNSQSNSLLRTPSVSSGSLQRDADDQGLLMEDPETTFVWGTNVNVAEAQSRFRRFLANYQGVRARPAVRPFVRGGQDTDSMDSLDLGVDVEGPKYPSVILDTIRRGESSIDLDCLDLHSYDEELYSQLISYPQEIVPLFDIVVNEVAQGLVQQDEDMRQQYSQSGGADAAAELGNLAFRLQVRTFNLREVKTMRGLDPSDVDHLVSVKGMVTHVSSILPDLKQACFKCSVCGHTPEPVYIDRGNIQEPQKCQNCNSLNSMILLHNRCLFSNKQQVKMQETPDTVPEGETPSTMATYVFDDHVDAIKPGDRVKVTGIFRALPVRVASRQRNLRSVFKTYVDVIHVEKDDPNDSASFLQSKISREAAGTVSEADDDDTAVKYSEQEVQAFREIAQGPDIYARLVRSLAPSIWELDDVKRGILCQLFSGTRKGLQTGERLRSEVNVLLCGDPGTSKSQLMSYVHKLSPRGIYTSGRGSSSVGLTAYVARDPETRELVLESGALVLSDLGVCCIDEFDKMSDDARNALHEAMEQQTVSLAKAGIICTLNARTSVLASANPAGSRYNPNQSVVENLRLPSTLLSRFDLIFLILDKADLAADRQLARHLVSLHNPSSDNDSGRGASDIISLDMLRAYILYAQQMCKPVISDDAAEALVNYYVEMRRMGTSAAGTKVITSTPRQLESLVRLSEALAKMKLSKTVEVADVDEAARLVKVALQQSATDPRTGTIDMDLIQTGVSSSLRQMRHKLEQEVRGCLAKAAGRTMTSSDLLRDLKESLQSQAPSTNELWEVLQQMSDGGRLNIRGDKLALA